MRIKKQEEEVMVYAEGRRDRRNEKGKKRERQTLEREENVMIYG